MVRVRLYNELYNTFFRTLIDTLKHLASLHLFFLLFGQKVITCFTGEYLDFCPFGCCRRQILSSHKAPAYVIFCPFCCHKRPIHNSLRHPPMSYSSIRHSISMDQLVSSTFIVNEWRTFNIVSIVTCVGTFLALFDIQYCNVILWPGKVTLFYLW